MQLYRLTDEELEILLEASRPPLRYMTKGDFSPALLQMNANYAWKKIAQKHGFDWETVKPSGTGDEHDFDAEPLVSTGLPNSNSLSSSQL